MTRNRIGYTLSAKIPEEPPVNSIIVTANGYAWQSAKTPFGIRWIRGGFASNFHVWDITWLELVAVHGPVTILFIPKENEEE